MSNKTLFKIVFLILVVLIVIGLNLPDEKPAKPITTNAPAVTAVKDSIPQDFKDSLKITVMMYDLAKEADHVKTLTVASAIIQEFNDLLAYQDALKTLQSTASEYTKKTSVKALAKLKSVQRLCFPIMRRNYVNAAAKLLWQDNAYAEGSGDDCQTVTFTAGAFASNKVIQKTQDELQGVLQKLRFKKAVYKWYRHQDSDYTYYKIASLDDGEEL